MPEEMKLQPMLDGFFKQQLSFETRNLWRSLLAVAVLLSVSIAGAAQAASSQQPAEVAIHGRVLDSTGKPVVGALVRLEAQGSVLEHGTGAVTTTTNTEGTFVFPALRAATYLISAEKSDRHSQVATVAALTPADHEQIDLVLQTSKAAASSTSSAEAIAFADKPDFTVAGITDWTTVGGHGSDSSLRTSESLARETTTLKPENSGRSAIVPPSAAVVNESEAKLRAALAEDPRSFQANHQLGEFCLRMGSYNEAVPLLETAYQIDPQNYGNEYDLALAYKDAGNFSRAREHVQKLLAHEDNADLHTLLGDVDEEAGDSLTAVREYEQAARLDPSEENYFTWGSELLLHRAVWPAAEVFRKGSEAYPKSARMLAALGAALFASARYDEAALRLCDASDLNPADPAPYMFLGKIDMAAPKPLVCVEPKLMRFAQQQPGNARANFYFAMAIWKRQKESASSQDMQQIESLLTKAAADDPGFDEAYLQLGNFYSGERNFKKAITLYTKAIEVNPQLSEAHYRLGMAYERTGDPAKARQEFQLHDEIEKVQAAAVERQRREIRQFMVVLNSRPAPPAHQ
jgi:tetratricopeptide (TPR) repeat protein